jgi:uncharacterized membrane protein
MKGAITGRWWRRLLKRNYLTAKEEEAVVAAIRDAERGNRGEVRVHLEAHCPEENPVRRAAVLFRALSMEQTAGATGVLLYVAVKDRRAAVFAGAGIHRAANDGFWQDAIDAVAGGFASGEPASGIIRALDMIGSLLRASVPGDDVAGNELPDAVTQS